MSLQNHLTPKVLEAVHKLYHVDVSVVEFQPTHKDFEGDITLVIFPLLRFVKGNPVEIGNAIGAYLQENSEEVAAFNTVKGFLNLCITDTYYLNVFNTIYPQKNYGYVKTASHNAVMVEYASPNTNKPVHLGHMRNILLGYAVAEILKAAGKKVYKTQISNDRGIHICKSMLAWQKYGQGETPESSGLKGDHLVGKYYVTFNKVLKEQVAELVSGGIPKEQAEKEAPILREAREMLQKWEAADPQVIALWKTMNQWVYNGFETTYKNLGVGFDKIYYESETYLLGKEAIQEGLKKGVFFAKPDGSVWIDLTEEGLDEKIVLRADGTAVYITQDIGTAVQRVKDFPEVNGMVYTVGNEQDYHFKVLFLILQKLGYPWAKQLYHLSYGMVDLPDGKMKSREGTVVDADDLIQTMETTAEEISKELGKLEGYSPTEKQQLYHTIGLGALKYFILKVDPKKRVLFNPKESIDFQGNTGPFIQYTYARIQSILRKATITTTILPQTTAQALHIKERELIKYLQYFPETIQEAAKSYSPAQIANYTYSLAKEFNAFYQQVSILGETDVHKRNFRIQLSEKVGEILQSAFKLLGIQVPERM